MTLKNDLASKRCRTRSDYPFHIEYQTRWLDNDMYSHLNNTIYPVLFDSIVNTYLIKHCGLNPFTRSSSSNSNTNSGSSAAQIGIIVSAFCDYFASVSFPDVLDLGLRVCKLGSSSVTYEVGVFRKGEEDVKGVGGYTHVFVPRETMRPVKGGMEERIREGLEKLVVDGSNEYKPKL